MMSTTFCQILIFGGSFLLNPKTKRIVKITVPKKRRKLPEGEEKKTESKDYSSEERLVMACAYILIILIVSGFIVSCFDAPEQHQISFQEFKNKRMEPGLVDHIVISNNSVARVFVRSAPLNQTNDEGVQGPDSASPARGHGGQYKYHFNVGSIEHFEEKLEEAQQALNIDPHDYVPLTYVKEFDWHRILMGVSPALLVLGSYYFMLRRMRGRLGGLGGGGGGGGGGGRGGRGKFNIGKARIMKVDKKF